MDFPLSLELMVLIIFVIVVGANVIAPIISESKAYVSSPIVRNLYDIIILFVILADVVLIVAWLGIAEKW